MKHFYILYETGQSGYILSKAKSNLYLQEMETQYQKISDFIAEKLYLGKTKEYVLEKLKPIAKYAIDTHKAVINLDENKQEKSLIRLYVAPGENDNLYFIATHNEINYFSKVSRFEPSVDCFFSSIIKDEDGDDAKYALNRQYIKEDPEIIIINQDDLVSKVGKIISGKPKQKDLFDSD